MKVLCIAGSPRHKGNTYLLLEKAVEGANQEGAQTELIKIADLKISPCRECGGCDNTGKCVVDDDMQIIYPKLVDADLIILASPIFFGNITANLKAMIDRCQCLWVRKYRLGDKISEKSERRGLFISVCAGRKKDFFPAAELVLKTFFATIDVSYSGKLFLSEVDEKGDVLLHPDFLNRAFMLGGDLAKGEKNKI